MNKIRLASDHAGYELKEFLKKELVLLGYEVRDFGTSSLDSVDYPDYANQLCEEMSLAAKINPMVRGILVCGSGQGMNIAANRFAEIRSALCYSDDIVKLARQHNDANVIALGSRFTKKEDAIKWVQTFLTTPFEGGRHQQRVAKFRSHGV